MFIEGSPQVDQTQAPSVGVCQAADLCLDGIPDVPPRKPLGIAVASLAGVKRIREAYQTATDTWVGAD